MSTKPLIGLGGGLAPARRRQPRASKETLTAAAKRNNQLKNLEKARKVLKKKRKLAKA